MGFYLAPAQLPLPLLPLRGSVPLTGASVCLPPVCWSTPGVALEGSLLCHLVFSHVPCSSSGPAACAAFPAAGSLGGFQVTGCLSFCFPGDVGWASARVAESEVFGWSRSRNPKSTRSRSRNF